MRLFQIILARLLTMMITLFGAAVVVFVLIRVVPGNPIAMMLPPNATDADVELLTRVYGLDKSIAEQFFIWIAGVLRGDFGTSISLRQPVAELVLGRIPATLELAFFASGAVIFGTLLALAGTRFRGGRAEGAVDVANGIHFRCPTSFGVLSLSCCLVYSGPFSIFPDE